MLVPGGGQSRDQVIRSLIGQRGQPYPAMCLSQVPAQRRPVAHPPADSSDEQDSSDEERARKGAEVHFQLTSARTSPDGEADRRPPPERFLVFMPKGNGLGREEVLAVLRDVEHRCPAPKEDAQDALRPEGETFLSFILKREEIRLVLSGTLCGVTASSLIGCFYRRRILEEGNNGYLLAQIRQVSQDTLDESWTSREEPEGCDPPSLAYVSNSLPGVEEARCMWLPIQALSDPELERISWVVHHIRERQKESDGGAGDGGGGGGGGGNDDDPRGNGGGGGGGNDDDPRGNGGGGGGGKNGDGGGNDAFKYGFVGPIEGLAFNLEGAAHLASKLRESGSAAILADPAGFGKTRTTALLSLELFGRGVVSDLSPMVIVCTPATLEWWSDTFDQSASTLRVVTPQKEDKLRRPHRSGVSRREACGHGQPGAL